MNASPRTLSLVLLLAGLLLAGPGCGAPAPPEDPAPAASEDGDAPMVDQVPRDSIPPAPVRPPEEARADLLVEEGFAVELVAAEPDVIDPVAVAFDGDGAMWVVEMRGYMETVEGDAEEPVGRIRVLRDMDGDGSYEHSRTFVGGLNLPRAVMPMQEGVLVAEPPYLYHYARAGDGYEAGLRTVVDSVYAVDGNPEHLPNGLLWARDNWIYSAKADARYRYAGGRWVKDSTEFRGQWGITQDDYGRLFYNHNSATLLGDDFLPNTFPANPHHERAGDPPYGEQKVSNRVFPRRMTPGVNRAYRQGVLDDEARLVTVTAAAGPTIYRGDQFPEAYYGNAFVAEPAGNLVKRVILADTSGEVGGRLPYEGREFATATDERFRPTNLTTAPDGSLIVVDMYRGVIQHKTYLTEYLRRQIEYRDLDVPIGLGRIYRVRYEGRPLGDAPRMRSAPSARLVEHLTHPNGWWRDTAQRLLVERGDCSVRPALEALAVDASRPVSQVHALWTLDGLGALTVSTLRRAAAAADDAKVRTAVVHLARVRAPAADALALLETLRDDALREVDLQVALALPAFREAHPNRVEAALADLVATYGTQPIFQDAVLGALEDRERAFGEALERRGLDVPPAFGEALAAARVGADVKPVTHADVLTAEEQALLEDGQALYAGACESCHGTDGTGLEDLGPPLVRSQWVLQDPETLVRITLDGLQGPIDVDGVTYEPLASMPGHRASERLTDERLAALLTFVRNAWENRAGGVSPEMVGRVRAATADHAGQTYSAGEIERIEASDEAWMPLVDGETLDGWERLGGEATYRVEDGTIVGTTVAGTPHTFLATRERYGDFVLELDVQVDSLLNSGVQIRSNSYAGYRDGRVHGYQVEIDPSERAWTGGLYDEARRGWLFPLDSRRAAREAFRQGAWNHLRIEARGAHLRTWVNGVLAADLIDPRTDAGFIALQVHSIDDQDKAGRHVRWKNIRIKDLSRRVVTASLDPEAAPVMAATDGDPSTYWRDEAPSAWLQFDLREARSVEGVTINFHEGSRHTYRFAVLLSDDGEAWREAFRGESRGTDTAERYPFDAQRARYVRIVSEHDDGDVANAYAEVDVLTPRFGEDSRKGGRGENDR